ncbi:MAG: hypothetical protein M1819_005268 [Sarea resinae]|nr:MAG: hypothetical protein M1819_005268 [Sarea resinae]
MAGLREKGVVMSSTSHFSSASTETLAEEEHGVEYANPHVQESIRAKYGLLPGLAGTTLVTFLLLAGAAQNWTITGEAYRAITSHRATVQLVVQVLSLLLGSAQVYAVCALINFSTRLMLTRNPASLDQMKLWNALCGSRLEWTLPWRQVVVLGCFVSLTVVPSSLWTGAITPIDTYGYRSSYRIDVPRYSAASEPFWNITTDIRALNEGTVLRETRGTFSYQPARDLQGSIQDAAAAASCRNGSEPIKKKMDHTPFAYRGRSFGAGASVGLSDEGLAGFTYYNYTEVGYLTDIACTINSSSNYYIVPIGNSDTTSLPALYLATGYLPNSSPNKYESYSTAALINSTGIVAFQDVINQGKYMYAVATLGDIYAGLNHTQCTTIFTPTLLSVSVDVRKGIITVSPTPGEAPDLEASGTLLARVHSIIRYISMINTSLYTSTLGNVLASNIANVVASNETANSTSSTLGAIEASMESMMDDALLAYNSAQLMIAQDSVPTPASGHLPGVRIGQPGYIYAITIINAAVLLLVAAECWRTRGWHGLLRFDYRDIKTVILGSAAGGAAIASAARNVHRAHGTVWTADPADRVAGKVHVVLDESGMAFLPGSTAGLSPPPLEKSGHLSISAPFGRSTLGFSTFRGSNYEGGFYKTPGSSFVQKDPRDRWGDGGGEGTSESHDGKFYRTNTSGI